MTPNEMADAVLAKIKQGMAAMKAELLGQIKALEESIAAIPAGRDGRDGTNGDPGDPGRNGRDGKDGRDGLGFEDLEASYDGERSVTFKFSRGDRVKEFRFEFPIFLDKGYWKDGTEAKKGDGMTFGGSYWIAQTETKSKPEVGCADWRLAVKRGRDGKDGDKGDRGPQGEKGLPGMNGKNLG